VSISQRIPPAHLAEPGNVRVRGEREEILGTRVVF